MLRKLFSVTMCAVLLAQNTLMLHAEEEETIYPEDLLVEAEDPYRNEVNDLIVDDEGSDAYGINVEYHSIGKIREYYLSHMVNFLNSAYQDIPSLTAPFDAGTLTDATLNDALKTVNLIRYIAGLNYNVTLSDTYTNMLQTGSLINAVNGSLSNSPSKPAAMSTSMYQLGLEGNSHGDVAYGYSSLGTAITDYWLNAADENEIKTLRNRRWLLNATMSQTGFGQVGDYSGMYTYDTAFSSPRSSNVWPAQNTPIEFFSSDSPWSISTGNTENINNIKVTMTEVSSQTQYIFTKASAPGYFAVDNSGYGVPGTVIWKPDNFTYEDGDSYEIEISGLTIGPVYYRVKFFQLDLSNEKVVMNPESLDLEVGEEAKVYYSISPSTSTDKISKRTYKNNGVIRIDHGYSSRFEITAMKPGTTYIRVETKNGLQGFCHITVHGVAITPETYEASLNSTIQLSATHYPESESQEFTWASSDTGIATVDQNGLVTTVGCGTCNITASCGGYTGTCTLNVTAPISGITLSSKKLILTTGGTSQLSTVITPAGAGSQPVVWTSSDTSVASVNESGLVTAHKSGNAVIRAASAENPEIYDECNVYVAVIANSATMALEGLLKVNFYVTVPSDIAETTYIRMKLASQEEGIRVKASEAPLDDNGRRFLQCPVATAQLNEEITMTAEDEQGAKLPMYTASGRDVTEGLKYSAMTYINNKVNNESTETDLKELLKATGEYGRYAQKYFNYGTLDKEPAEITDVSADDLLAYKTSGKSGVCEGITLKSATTECNSGTNVHVHFTIDSGKDIEDYEYLVDNELVTPEWNETKKAYRISSKDIPSNALQNMYTFVIRKKGETAGVSITYGVFSFGYSKLSNASTSAELAGMVKAQYKYNQAAIAKFGISD